MKFERYLNIAEFLRGISSTSRIKILCYLESGEKYVSQITMAVGDKMPYVSEQLRYLHQTGYVKRVRKGKRVYYSIKDKRILEVFELLASYLDDLEKERLNFLTDPIYDTSLSDKPI